MTQPGRPAVFVHGLWLHASSWGPWLELFQEAGYAPVAPGWPGDLDTVEESRRDPSHVAGKGIDDVVEQYARIIRGREAPPGDIGPSLGGLTGERLLGGPAEGVGDDGGRGPNPGEGPGIGVDHIIDALARH